MRHIEAILAAGIALSLSGCVLRGKPPVVAATPAPPKPVEAPAPPLPPPAALSVPQPHPDLPPPQPISAEALATTEAPGEPPAPKPVTSRPARRAANPPAVAPPKPEAAPAAAPPAAAPPEPEPRPPIQEIVPAEVQNRLKSDADQRKMQIRQRLGQLSQRRLNKEQRDVVDRINSFVNLSDEAERTGDMRKAYELAERGAILAQGLPGGR